mmetsp:Transcript_7953/g.20078  ORF Transcript_7953/g.20078 Transcript_7953/m.20078 type:complete len:551 (+) Transcript_7953:99-1751(+)
MGLSETFINAVWQELGPQCCLALLEPWSASTQIPARVIAPLSPFSELCPGDARHKASELAKDVPRRATVLVPCTVDTCQQQVAAKAMFPALSNIGACVIAVLLTHPIADQTKEFCKRALARSEALMKLGAANVIIDYGRGLTAQELTHKVEVAFAVFSKQTLRIQPLDEDVRETEKELKAVRTQYHRALWHEMPKLIMPRFPKMNPDMVETSTQIGKYAQKQVFKESRDVKVFEAMDEAVGNMVIIKTTKKTDFTTAEAVEGMYREFSFLTDLTHPHIVRCLEALHGRQGVHTVFERIPGRSLSSEVANQAGQRLRAPIAMDCFRQIGSAIAHCHEKRICHRSICLDHVLAYANEDPSRYKCVLFHFSTAVVFPQGCLTRASSVIGKPPYVPPEVFMGGSYSYICADAWALGILLLELAGGMGSAAAAIDGVPTRGPSSDLTIADSTAAGASAQAAEPQRPVPLRSCDTEEERATLEEKAAAKEAAIQATLFFQQEGAHAEALAWIGGVQDDLVTYYLQKFLQPKAKRRSLVESEISPAGLLLSQISAEP